tara:strand:+ start:897 stop:1304 length:408 start_codon:yes stop_codon:yes gene_type:complete
MGYSRERQRAYGYDHYHRNREQYIQRSKVRSTRIRKEHNLRIREIKEASPCVDCGVSYPSCVMQFDHMPGTVKRFNLADMGDRSWTTVLAEIRKCEIVCANCHAVRTHKRRAEEPAGKESAKADGQLELFKPLGD